MLTREELEAELHAEFPRARIERSDDTLEHVARIVRHLSTAGRRQCRIFRSISRAQRSR